MPIKKIKLISFFAGAFAGFISTWYNTYGDVRLWSFEHHLSMAILASISAFFIRITIKSRPTNVALFIALGIITLQLISIFYEFFTNQDQENVISYLAIIYALVAFMSSFIGSMAGQIVLKDKYK